MLAELQAICADLMSCVRPVDIEPLTVHDDVVDGVLVRTLRGRCAAGCVKGWVIVQHEGGYEVTRPCGTCASIADGARRFSAARFPLWVGRVRAEWSGVVTIGDMHRVSGDIANGRGRLWYGPPGTGKSYMAAAVGLDLVESTSVRWLHWPSFVARCKDEVAGDGRLGAVVTKLVGSPRVLIVDELAGRRTDFEAELAERIIGARAESGAIVATTNMSPEHCRAYLGDRVWSRLGASCRVAEIGGADRRRAA